MTPVVLTREYWLENRCPFCGSAGMFIHALYRDLLQCDACGIEWQPQFIAEKLVGFLLGWLR